MLPESIFITGTDTGVGKTAIAAAIALSLRHVGVNVRVFKPVETGVPTRDEPSDAELLARAAQVPVEEVCVYRLKAPLAPAVAAQLEGIEIDIQRIVERFNALRRRSDVVIVEGAGGVLVPLRWGNGESAPYFSLDLIRELRSSALIVARAGLGTINHTLLTWEALTSRGVARLGIALNCCGSEPDLAERTNPEAVRRGTGCNRVFVCPHGGPLDRWEVATSLRPFVEAFLRELD